MVILITGMIVLSGSVGESLAKEPIKIGFIGALSTPYGVSNKAALEISIDELNEAGGILGRPVELVTEDWKQQVPLAVAAYKKLVMKDKCLLIFTEGTEGSMACAQIASRLYSSYPHLLFSFWSSGLNMDIIANEYDKYKFLFLVYPSVSDTYNPALKVVDFFKNTIGTKKLALLIEDIGWTEVYQKGKPGVFPPLKEYVEKNGIKVVYYSTTDIKEKMFLPIFEKVAASGADTIWVFSGYTDTVTLVKQWAQSPAKNMDLVFQNHAIGCSRPRDVAALIHMLEINIDEIERIQERRQFFPGCQRARFHRRMEKMRLTQGQEFSDEFGLHSRLSAAHGNSAPASAVKGFIFLDFPKQLLYSVISSR